MKRHRSVLLKNSPRSLCCTQWPFSGSVVQFGCPISLEGYRTKIGTVRHSSVPIPTSVANKGKTWEKKKKRKEKKRKRKGKEKKKVGGLRIQYMFFNSGKAQKKIRDAEPTACRNAVQWCDYSTGVFFATWGTHGASRRLGCSWYLYQGSTSRSRMSGPMRIKGKQTR